MQCAMRWERSDDGKACMRPPEAFRISKALMCMNFYKVDDLVVKSNTYAEMLTHTHTHTVFDRCFIFHRVVCVELKWDVKIVNTLIFFMRMRDDERRCSQEQSKRDGLTAHTFFWSWDGFI